MEQKQRGEEEKQIFKKGGADRRARIPSWTMSRCSCQPIEAVNCFDYSISFFSATLILWKKSDSKLSKNEPKNMP